MSGNKKVAVVTGANKGIGLAIVEILSKAHNDWTVYLCARDKGRGEAAVASLKGKGINNVKFHLLDVTSNESAQALAADIKKDEGGVDVLVNNAGIAYGMSQTAPLVEQAEKCVATNYMGIVYVSKAIFPLLRPHARVVHVSSRVSNMTIPGCSEALQKKFKSSDLTEERLTEMMKAFVQSTRDGNYEALGWPPNAYGVSKIGPTAVAPVHQKFFDKTRPKDDIIVNSCCPGIIATDLTVELKSDLKRTPFQGAETPVYLAQLPANTTSPRGDMVADCKVIGWGQEYPEYMMKILGAALDPEALAKGKIKAAD